LSIFTKSIHSTHIQWIIIYRYNLAEFSASVFQQNTECINDTTWLLAHTCKCHYQNIFSNVCCIQPDTSFLKTSNEPKILLQIVKTLPAFWTSCNPNTHKQHSFYRAEMLKLICYIWLVFLCWGINTSLRDSAENKTKYKPIVIGESNVFRSIC